MLETAPPYPTGGVKPGKVSCTKNRSRAIQTLVVRVIPVAMVDQFVARFVLREDTAWWASWSSTLLSAVFGLLFELFLESVISK